MRTLSAALAAAPLALALIASAPAVDASPAPPPVVGGNPAAQGRWNDAAVVVEGDIAVCTGTLIAPDLIITAAHCVGGVTSVTLGEVDLTARGGDTIPVAREIEYPDSFATYDVGLLVLERPSSYTPRVIATGCVLERYLENGAPVEIVGWGAVDPDGSQETDVLMEAESVVTDRDCTAVERGCNPAVSPGGELGAGGDSVDSCFGDSGGPLYLLTDIGEYLLGITSRGYTDAQVPCGEGGIYVRADAVIEWIEDETGVSVPRANCNARPEPTADATELEVTAGESVRAAVEAHDPDAADTHVYTVATAPMHGRVSIGADGVVIYAADDDHEGIDRFAVEVADSGIPSLSGQVQFEVTVLPGEGCGCRASRQGPGAVVLIALAALIPLLPGRRRRRPR